MVFGEVECNKKLLEFLSQNEIMMHYFNHYSYYLGTFYPREHYNSGHVLLKQAECYLDEERRLALAKHFVRGAILNIQQVLKYYHKRGAPLSENIERLKATEPLIQEITSISELMALEGNAREIYYGAFDRILNNPDFTFEKR